MNIEAIHKKSMQMQAKIIDNKDLLVMMLGKYESYETAKDEIARSISALGGARDEFKYLTIPENQLRIATFFPLNLPLYSLVIFALVPGLFAERVVIRAPTTMQVIVNELFNLLDLQEVLPNIVIKNISRATFLEVYAESSDIILFTGKYVNALDVKKRCPNSLLIFNGGGVNPAIVFSDADTDLAAKKIVEMRTFNSGQDCAGTDVIFLHKSIAEEVTNKISVQVEDIKVGQYGDPETQIGPILKKEYVESLSNFIETMEPYVVKMGFIDYVTSTVSPYVISRSIDSHHGEFHEFFAPVFYILTFERMEQLVTILSQPDIEDFSMYISHFGTDPALETLKTSSQLLHGCIINDVEQGNKAYGGYGKKANFVSFGRKTISRPILISHEIDSFYKNNGIVD